MTYIQSSPGQSPETLSGGQILVRSLQAQGVDRAFGVPGESYLAVLDALCDAPDIEMVTCRQEGGAAMMAEADGRLIGRPGVCFVTRGPGATNASAGVHVAYQASTPMVLFIGQVARNQQDREAFQEIDYRRMFGQMAKWIAQVESPTRLPEYINRAFAVAMSGRPGPVVIALPEDMLRETSSFHPLPSVPPIPVAAPAQSDLVALQELLAVSERPLVLCGESGWNHEARELLQAFCEAHGVAAVAAFRCQDRFDNSHPNYIGDCGLGINPALRQRIESADLVLVLGGRLSEIVTQNYEILVASGNQKLVHVHPCPDELVSVRQPDIAMVSQVEAVAEALLKTPPAEDILPQRKAWVSEARASYEAWSTPGTIPGTLQYGELVQHLCEQLPEDAIICNGAGNYTVWVHRYYRYRAAHSQLAPISGSMGYGLPAAIAAKLRHPDRDVLCFAGDGCLQMTMQELATAKQYGANIIVLVVNNGSYGTIRTHQEKNYPGRVMATELLNPDFAALASAYGFHSASVDRTEDFFPAFEAARAAGVPGLIELRLPLEALSPSVTLSQLQNAAKNKN
ncbi:thiamine pyrophosphate-binding protein [Biformimicrobium ophioploci]|uniref:Thiamine pyrophosphate-binding protein n=1 Tax=Biformimicrobium ophioploci TaxID=3036711 RepID=A0ABQ6LXE9_9GAMM|nr:thiamine pyrophosphate-binding protein [Microbulbifer sp. NKW57]GMG86786.1 thiamine pyrophosphate-binding protein [Microbulbifer sp. NKW57]